MKKLALVLACVFALGTQMFAMGGKPVEVNNLPVKVQEFIKTYFGFTEVSYAKQDTELLDRGYTVVFTNGDKADFTASGEWEEIDCEHNVVPKALVPDFVKKFVENKHKGQKVVELKKEKRGRYEVKLANGVEMHFNNKGQMIRYDD